MKGEIDLFEEINPTVNGIHYLIAEEHLLVTATFPVVSCISTTSLFNYSIQQKFQVSIAPLGADS